MTRLHDSKGNSYLVDAAPTRARRRPQARFFLVGEGPLRADLEQQASALGLGDRFVFAGFARDVARVVSAFDLSVFPSLWEGTPLTVFEALAMGKTIRRDRRRRPLDVLTHEHDAVIVPKRDAAALAAGIVRLIDDPAERARLGGAARGSRPAVRHRCVRAQDGAAVRAAAPRVAADAAPRDARGGSVVPRQPGHGMMDVQPARASSMLPGILLTAVLLCVYGGWRSRWIFRARRSASRATRRPTT